VALKLKGDWLGFDGIAEGRYTPAAVCGRISSRSV